MALSSISTNTLLQQQALQSQLTATQSATAAPTATDTTATPAVSATTNPATALVSGNAALTSDLLSVLLNEQSGASSSSGGGTPTLAGMLDQQDIADQTNGTDPAQQQADAETNLFNDLDSASAAQSATSTDTVMSGLQDLLAQLSV